MATGAPKRPYASPKPRTTMNEPSHAFAPFSDSRPYTLQGTKPPASAAPSLRRPMPPPPLLRPSPSPAPGAGDPESQLRPPPRGAYPDPPATPYTSRILESTYAAKVNREGQTSVSGAIAFSSAAASIGSPRVVVLSPRKPIAAQLPSELQSLTKSPHFVHHSSSSPNGASRQRAQIRGSEALIERGIPVKELSLFTGDRSWLFYPQRGRPRRSPLPEAEAATTLVETATE